MELKLDEVSIRCMGCREANTLEGAVADDWRICENCQFFICRFCLENLGDSKYCLSYPCRRANRSFALGSVPVERVILFARAEERRAKREGLLHRLFFAGSPETELPFTLSRGEPSVEEYPPADSRPTTVQEEIWRNHRLVVTKRKGGQFITWEKIL